MLQEIQTETTTTRPYPAARHFETLTEVGSLAALAHTPVYEPERRPPETTVVGEFFFRWAHATTEQWGHATTEQWGHATTEIVPAGGRRDEPSGEDKLHAELLAYLDLPEGWNGYEGEPASFDAVIDAIDFLKMRPDDIPLPYPQIAPDGEVGLYWRVDEVYAEVGFYGDGECSYYAHYTPAGGESDEYGRDGCSLDAGEWPEGLLLVLNKLAR